jgi:hypothetical protein
MSNTRLVRQGKRRREAYILFEGRRYFNEELSKLIGQTLSVHSYPCYVKAIKAIGPDGEYVCQLQTKTSSAQEPNHPVELYLRYQQERHTRCHGESITSADLRRRRE